MGSIVENPAKAPKEPARSPLALKLARAAIAAKGGTWAVLDTEHSFYPLGALPLGLELEKLLLIRTQPRNAAWAFNQLLRCPELGACFMSHAADGQHDLSPLPTRRQNVAADWASSSAPLEAPTQTLLGVRSIADCE